MDLQVVVTDRIRFIPKNFDQFVFPHHDSLMKNKIMKNLKLEARQGDFNSFQKNLSPLGIHNQWTERKPDWLHIPGIHFLAAANQCIDPRQKLPAAERFFHEIIRTVLESPNFHLCPGLGRDCQNGSTS